MFSVFWLALLAAACGKRATPSAEEQARSGQGVQRGAEVVVEQTAAEFFEGKVLAIEGERLKVQALASGEVLSVARADVMALPGRATAAALSFAICRIAAQSWLGCRVARSEPSGVSVELPDGSERELAKRDVISASELSALNIARRFQREAARRSFEREARDLKPRVAPAFRPGPRERLLARGDGGYWTANVHELVDDGAYVTWPDARPATRLELGALAPLPPYSRPDLHRGDFVLLPPVATAERWRVARVEQISEGKLSGTRADGERFESDERSVVPLVR